MKTIMLSLICFFSSTLFAGTAMKLEGTCHGTLKNRTSVSFNYYSSFNGCRDKSSAAISFTSGIDSGLYTGTRNLGTNDVYSFNVKEARQKSKELVRLTFANSTGNTGGTLRYIDDNSKLQSIKVRCEIRDYEYGECE